MRAAVVWADKVHDKNNIEQVCPTLLFSLRAGRGTWFKNSRVGALSLGLNKL